MTTSKPTMIKINPFHIRKMNRWYSLVFGIQTILAVIAFSFFNLSNKKDVPGDFQKKDDPRIPLSVSLVSPGKVFDAIRQIHRIDSVASLRLIYLSGRPVYQVRAVCIEQNESDHGHQLSGINYLVNADSGEVRQHITKEEAVAIAKSQFYGLNEIKQVDFLKVIDNNHPYYGNPLPAYAVTLTSPSERTVYITSESATVGIVHNGKLRPAGSPLQQVTQNEILRNKVIMFFLVWGLITNITGLILCFVNSLFLNK